MKDLIKTLNTQKREVFLQLKNEILTEEEKQDAIKQAQRNRDWDNEHNSESKKVLEDTLLKISKIKSKTTSKYLVRLKTTQWVDREYSDEFFYLFKDKKSAKNFVSKMEKDVNKCSYKKVFDIQSFPIEGEL
jgi:uncharacterized protein YycO